MSGNAIFVEGIGKEYRLGSRGLSYPTLRDALVNAFSIPIRKARMAEERPLDGHRDTIWALKDVSFEVHHGEVIGVIGSNGAGKSTLLKVLSRITDPTEGFAEIRGRVRALLEVGTGFHPELTGRENIFLNGAILGMRKAEIIRKFDEIVAFSEIEKFLDTPVKRYSSGMYVRLAFSVAAHLEPEILIIDEVLSVGDVAFQKKCLGKIGEASRGGRTVLFVSHNMAAVENLCQRCIFLKGGRVAYSGDTDECIKVYLRSFPGGEAGSSSHIVDLTQCTRRPEFRWPWLRCLEVFTNGTPLNGSIPVGAPMTLRIGFHLEEPVSSFDINVGFDSVRGQRLFTAHTLFDPNRIYEERVGDQVFECDIPSLPFTPGEYIIRISVELNGNRIAVDAVEDAMRFTVAISDYYGTGRAPWNGLIALPHRWRLL
jgi:lipopolysaccharide transport system ATP-binding protein